VAVAWVSASANRALLFETVPARVTTQKIMFTPRNAVLLRP
jgi:hypothetical protein